MCLFWKNTNMYERRLTFVFTRVFRIFQCEQCLVESGLVLTRVEPGLVGAV